MCESLNALLQLIQKNDGVNDKARDWENTPGMAKQSGKRKRTDALLRAIYYREKSPPRSDIINPRLSLWLMGFPDEWLKIN
jgi:hypothetical protein